MKITAQEEYGLRCLLRLAAAWPDSALTIPEIAELEGLSEAYVAKLMAVLRRNGIVVSERGRTGGYRLAQSPEAIGLGEVLLTLGEPLFAEPDYCDRYAGTQTEDGQCVHVGACSLRSLWSSLEDWIRSSLDRISLIDLLNHDADLGEFFNSRLGSKRPSQAVPLKVRSTKA